MTKELEIGFEETEVQPGVQGRKAGETDRGMAVALGSTVRTRV